MAGAVVDIRPVVAGLLKLRDIERYAPLFWRAWRNKVKAEVRSHRRLVKDRARSTKETHGRKRRLGKALTAYKTTADVDGVRMESLIAYSGTLNDGGVVGGSKHRAVLPKREFAYLGDAFVRTTANKYAAFVGDRWP